MESINIACKEKSVKLPYLGRTKNPLILERFLDELPNNCVLCEFLNKVAGGVSYEIRSPEKAANYNGDSSKELKHIYTKDELIAKIESLKEIYH